MSWLFVFLFVVVNKPWLLRLLSVLLLDRCPEKALTGGFFPFSRQVLLRLDRANCTSEIETLVFLNRHGLLLSYFLFHFLLFFYLFLVHLFLFFPFFFLFLGFFFGGLFGLFTVEEFPWTSLFLFRFIPDQRGILLFLFLFLFLLYLFVLLVRTVKVNKIIYVFLFETFSLVFHLGAFHLHFDSFLESERFFLFFVLYLLGNLCFVFLV